MPWDKKHYEKLDLTEVAEVPKGARTMRQTADDWGLKTVNPIRRYIQEGRVKAVVYKAVTLRIIYVLTKKKPERLPARGGRPRKDTEVPL